MRAHSNTSRHNQSVRVVSFLKLPCQGTRQCFKGTHSTPTSLSAERPGHRQRLDVGGRGPPRERGLLRGGERRDREGGQQEAQGADLVGGGDVGRRGDGAPGGGRGGAVAGPGPGGGGDAVSFGWVRMRLKSR